MMGRVSPVEMDLKSAVCRTIDARRDTIERVGREIFAAPELGYREQRTARVVADWFAQLGLRSETGLGLPGVKAVIEGGASGPTVAILGEHEPRRGSSGSWRHHQWHAGQVHSVCRTRGACRRCPGAWRKCAVRGACCAGGYQRPARDVHGR